MTYIKNASPFFVACMNFFSPTNRGLKCLDPLLPPIFHSCLNFCMRWLVLTMSTCAKPCSESNVLIGKALYFGVVSFIDSKWKPLSFQILCKMNYDNPMMIRLVRGETTLKTILLLCDPIIIVNALVSCVIGPKERFRPSITLTAISIIFSTNSKLCCCTNSDTLPTP
jgi:hypothetical protein